MIRQLPGRLTGWIRGLPRGVLVGAAVVVVVLLAAAALYGYRMYNYVQHDNQFCLSCHLMADPYQRFARSAHRDLGCKACHQPTPVARAKMALTQIVEQPESLQTHAEVPNSKCEACHVKGNPKEWQIISQTAGHRVHLQSKALVLRGLQCVECHSTSLHEFSTVDKTCGQSGCHEGIKVRLGKMSKLTLHCAACHDFTRPAKRVVGADSLGVLLRPEASDCFSCHAMRQRVRMPPDEPHNGACGLCHNPHEQATPHEAVKTCANSGCHESPEKISPMHRGLPTGKLQDCVACHQAHTFRIGNAASAQCTSCHSTGGPETARFPHSRHRGVACTSCHSNAEQHGALTITSPQQCMSCHHTTQVAANCTACHSASEFAGRTILKSQRLAIAGTTRTRQLGFNHQQHSTVPCAQCHADPMTRGAANVQCKACHADHHKTTSNCMACHPPVKVSPHTLKVHVGCAGSSCHKQLPAPLAAVPHTRQFCLACHQNMVNHRPSGNCADCHQLPAASGAR